MAAPRCSSSSPRKRFRPQTIDRYLAGGAIAFAGIALGGVVIGRWVAHGLGSLAQERVTILAETAMHPEEIDRAEAQQELQEGEKLWQEAGDDGEKYDEANAITRQAEEKIASAEGKST